MKKERDWSARAGIPMQHLERDPAKQAATQQPREKNTVEQTARLQPMEEPHARAGGYPLRNVAHRKTMLEQVYPERL